MIEVLCLTLPGNQHFCLVHVLIQCIAISPHFRKCACILGEFMDSPCSILFASPHQMTPLHRAAVQGHVDTVKFLVQEGANIHSKDNGGVSE